MKKITTLLLALVLALACTLAVVSCGDTVCNHVDKNDDGICDRDGCGASCNDGCDVHRDADDDGKCDKTGCGKSFSDGCDVHDDADDDGKCDKCSADYSDGCDVHRDADDDGVCDVDGCGVSYNDGVEAGPITNATVSDVCGLVASAAPTKVVTKATIVAANGDDLSSSLITEIEGSNSISTYTYKYYPTPAESLENGSFDRIATKTDVIYYKNGLYSVDGGASWEAAAPSALSVKFDLDEAYLTGAQLDDDGTVLTATVNSENAVNIFGTDMEAESDIAITVTTNGVNLYMVELSYTTASGATVEIQTTYTYQPISLEFPSAE
ncbi:MAG: hypothetical protein IJX38_05320 [Clostridia bacterium]|nr:hypothetical protein [Clostridia bacterium]